MNFTEAVAIYAAIVATCALGWQIWSWRATKKEVVRQRTKLKARFGVINHFQNVPRLGEAYICPLIVSNLGREPVLIEGVMMEKVKGKFYPGVYPEPQATIGDYREPVLPKRLDSGDTTHLNLFTINAFRERPRAVVISDAEGNEYRVPENEIDDIYRRVQRVLSSDDELGTQTPQ